MTPCLEWRSAASWIIASVLILSHPTVRAERPPEPKNSADLILTGTVERLYSSTDAVENHYIAAIRIQSVNQGTGVVVGGLVDARFFQRRPDAPQIPAAYGHKDVPTVGQAVKAYLMQREPGVWEGTYPYWIDRIGPDPAGKMLGVVGIPVQTTIGPGLQITQTVPGTVAARLGLEPGDILLSIDGRPVPSMSALRNAIASTGDVFTLKLRNVRTGGVLEQLVSWGPIPSGSPGAAAPRPR
jgi:membrane-associated protease RseP (regulator of RpoE activity)